MSCDESGPHNCDSDMCAIGYTRTRIDSCAQCLLGCGSCSSSNLGTCNNCLEGTYSDNGGCIICPMGCAECNSATQCTVCKKGY